MANFSLEAVSKAYAGGHTAVRDVSLEMVDGELLVLVGPSGCGKSTILRLLAGLETPTVGRIAMNGADITDLPPQQRDLAMVFQNYALYPHMSVRQNMAFGLRVRGIEAARIDERVRQTATALDLEPLLDRRPSQLSGGQRQRVALGRAIVREPKAFLLDEPLSNLDPLLRVATRTELILMQRRLGTTMVYVTHDQEEAMTLGSRVVVMHDGRIEQVAPPLVVFERPATIFVAQFVGSPSMNLWPGQIDAARTRVTTAAGAIDLTSGAAAGAGASGPVTVGIRPHEIELVATGDGHLQGQVEIVEPLGAQTIVHVKVAGLPAEMVRVIVSAAFTPRIGDRVGIRVPKESVHLFGGDGRRLDADRSPE
jgi:ABC-type sugar transport system ATPase subunit